MPDMFGGGQEQPEPLKFRPINIPEVIQTATDVDVGGYNWSDADFARQYPGLLAARQEEIQKAYDQLIGPLDPTLEGDFTKGALERSMDVVGGGNPLSGLSLTKGSLARGAASADVARNVSNQKEYYRQNFETLQGIFPPRLTGVSGTDAVNLMLYNLQGANQSILGNYSAAVNTANANYAQNTATYDSIGGLISGLGSLYGRYRIQGG